MPAEIMVIEDDKDIRKNLKRLLELEGYSVTLAQNGKDALDFLIAATKLPDLIFLDLTMPIMDGFEFRKAQLENDMVSKIPVVIMTADGHVQEKKDKIKASGVLKKPVELEDILKTAEKYCPKK